MKTTNIDIRPGRLFHFTSGEYSDFGIQGHFIALQHITEGFLAALVRDIKARLLSGEIEDPSCGYYDFSDPDDLHRAAGEVFVAAFARTGVALEVDSQPLHLGAYSHFTLVEIPEK
jgi:hypothetical protein